MTRRRTVDDWRAVVFKTKHIKDSTRVTLLLLSERMNANRIVSVPLVQMARALGKSERSLLRHISDAHEKGLLSTVERGYIGHTAVYQGVFPDAESMTTVVTHSEPKSMTKIDTLSSAQVVTLSERKSMTTVVTPYVERTSAVSGYDRDGRSNEERVPTTAASRLPCPVCEHDGCSHCEGE